jgi:pimeloyl-ACP methyl ester carboxylesterase
MMASLSALQPGTTLVLLHGLASNSTRWWHFAAHSRLPGLTLLRPTRRGGAGSSDRGRIDMRVWCDDLVQLLDAEGCDRAVIGGHCLGANLALHFAARHPERTAGLVLIEPMPPQALSGGLRWVVPLRLPLLALAALIRGLNRLGLRRRRLEPLDLEAWDRLTASGADLSRYASPLSDLRLLPVAAYVQSLAALAEPLPPLADVRAPALVLVSRGSTMTDPARTRRILEQLPEVQFTVLEAEHWIPTEQPDDMRAAIEEWLAAKFQR